jgi:transposase
MLYISGQQQYYLYREPTDMRKGFDKLCGIILEFMQMNILQGGVYIFLNKRRNQIKLIQWEGDGLAMYYKRLEKGSYEIPSISNVNHNINPTELKIILEGIQLQSIKKRVRYQHKSADRVLI